MSRIYVCHTFYHVYVSILKEMKLEREDAAYEKGEIAQDWYFSSGYGT